jgi:hypothetical protein
MTIIITTQTLPQFLITLSQQLEEVGILEVDIKPTQRLEDTEEFKEAERFVEECRKEPGRYDSVRKNMEENKSFYESLTQKYGIKNNRILRHK